jgi:hypothetical protein
MALSSVSAGKQYIQYAWGVAALVFIIAAFLAYTGFHMKRQGNPQKSSGETNEQV